MKSIFLSPIGIHSIRIKMNSPYNSLCNRINLLSIYPGIGDYQWRKQEY